MPINDHTPGPCSIDNERFCWLCVALLRPRYIGEIRAWYGCEKNNAPSEGFNPLMDRCNEHETEIDYKAKMNHEIEVNRRFNELYDM
ncbi:MAG: hypothetical protein KAS32_14460 [Candidatus Peribacteraceae bacterium]|nr:hypothetical protein [Candidatus Peribacteraceae bacterium]